MGIGTKQKMFAAALLAATVGASAPAMAGPKLFAAFNSSITINGTTETTANGNVDPFLIELFANANDCLRIAVTTQQTDLEATLVGPNGATWKDDDGGGNNLPLIKAQTVTRGWHILRISHFAGSSVNADFTAVISRSARTSLNCTPPTTPLVSSKSATAKAPFAGHKIAGGTN